VASFRAELQHKVPSSYVRRLATRRAANNVDRLPDHLHEQCRRLTPPITSTDLRHVPDLYLASTSGLALDVSGRRLGDVRAPGLQEVDEAELWLARSLHAGQVTSSEDDQMSKGDTEDELSK